MNEPELEPFDALVELQAEAELAAPPPEARNRVLAGVMTTVGVAAPIALGAATAKAVATAEGAAAVGTAAGAATAGSMAMGTAATATGLAGGGLLTKGAALLALLGVGGTTAVVVSDDEAPRVEARTVAQVAPAPERVTIQPRTTPAPTHEIAAAPPAEPVPVEWAPAPKAEAAPTSAERPMAAPPLRPTTAPRTKVATRPGVQGESAESREASAPRAAVAGVTPASAAPNDTTPARRDDDLAREQALLRTARRAIARGDTHAALTALRIHTVDFPRGRLSEERAFLRIRALARAGRRADARTAADAFRRRFPRSLLRGAIDALVGP